MELYFQNMCNHSTLHNPHRFIIYVAQDRLILRLSSLINQFLLTEWLKTLLKIIIWWWYDDIMMHLVKSTNQISLSIPMGHNGHHLEIVRFTGVPFQMLGSATGVYLTRAAKTFVFASNISAYRVLRVERGYRSPASSWKWARHGIGKQRR